LTLKDSISPQKIHDITQQYLQEYYPKASFEIGQAENPFSIVFGSSKSYYEAKIKPLEGNKLIEKQRGDSIHLMLEQVSEPSFDGFDFKKNIQLSINWDMLHVYDIPFDALASVLTDILADDEISTFFSLGTITKVKFGKNELDIEKLLKSKYVLSSQGQSYRLNELLTINIVDEPSIIYADQSGTYQSIKWNRDIDLLKVREGLSQLSNRYWISESGEHFDNMDNLLNFVQVFFVSLLLLYVVLAAQFESLIQPFIVISMLPLSVSGSVFLLSIFDCSLNTMSLIGIIIVLGIVVNDSILKIDTINSIKRKNPHGSIYDAIHKAGELRLKPILMTSLTTILALIPITLSQGIGAELQQPLVLSVIGGLVFGTLLSIYFIPIFYHLCYKK